MATTTTATCSSITATKKQHSFYKPPRTPPRVSAAADGDNNNNDDDDFSTTMLSDDDFYNDQHPNNLLIVSTTPSHDESRDSTFSFGGNSDVTERANNKTTTTTTTFSRPSSFSSSNYNQRTTQEDDGDDESIIIEVRKEDGATELFMLIESADWDEVCDRIDENPNEAKIWVTSSGKDNALFSWDVWRRLPLHEACRRQPPPVVIYALLSAYPASTRIESNFGELPLHAAVRCGACAEVVNCLLASYPGAVLERDNSGCTPMDILNGTGRIMDHDAVIAALNRTTNFLTNEETMFSWKMEQLELKHKQNMEEQGTKYETLIDKKNQQIKELKRLLQQEKKATSNLASKVIQTETLAQQKMVSEKRYMIMLEKMEGEMLDLNAANSVRTTKIVELEETIESDRKTIVELMEVIGTLRSELTSICMEEEHNLVKAEANLKAMFETQYVFLKETEKRKEMMRDRLLTLGISLSGCMSEEEEEEEEEGEEEESEDEDQSEVIPVPPPDEPSDDEVARVALASAMQAVESLMQQEKEEVFVDDVPEVE